MKTTTSTSEWYNVLNTTNRETTLNVSHDEDYVVIVTAWNKFGESLKDKNKGKHIYGKSIVVQGPAFENRDSGASKSLIHVIYGLVIGFIIVSCLGLLICYSKGLCRSGYSSRRARLRNKLVKKANKDPSKVFTAAAFENKNMSIATERESSRKCLDKAHGIHSQSNTKHRYHGKGIDLTSSAKGDVEERHYMSLIHATKSSMSKPVSRLKGQRRDNQTAPPGIVFHKTHNESTHKHDYMELMPGLKNAKAGEQKTNNTSNNAIYTSLLEQKTSNTSNDAIYMSLLSEKQANEILPEPVDAEKWEILPANLSVDAELVAGKFSVISKGRVRGLKGVSGEKTVAIKTLKEQVPVYNKKRFLIEVEMMKLLKPHLNVIEFLGHVASSEPLRNVMEYGDCGDLLNYLRSHRGTNNPYFREVNLEKTIDASTLLQFAKDVAKGMEYISSQNLVHLHLMARSILVANKGICKIGNFKLARFADDMEENTELIKVSVPLKWSAYETILFGNYSTQSDVWSYGVTLFEIFTVGGCPYPKVSKEALLESLRKGERIQKPKHVDKPIYKLMTDCWLEDPYERPEWEYVIDTLTSLEQNFQDHININKLDHSTLELHEYKA